MSVETRAVRKLLEHYRGVLGECAEAKRTVVSWGVVLQREKRVLEEVIDEIVDLELNEVISLG